ncbi:MAG: hypothetical protein DI529_03790 [Chryseobacterium sp.]|jgi:hypothetical protein|nr:MAG: hypothetical protein DI529_03790 [Chryseobacterium sp.]
MKIPNDNSIEQLFIKPTFSYYNHLKFIIKQGDIVNKEIFSVAGKVYNGIFALLAQISDKTVFCNANLIDFSSHKDYEIQRQEQHEQYNVHNPEANQTVVPILYEHEQFVSVLEKQFIKWWEEHTRAIITHSALSNN